MKFSEDHKVQYLASTPVNLLPFFGPIEKAVIEICIEKVETKKKRKRKQAVKE